MQTNVGSNKHRIDYLLVGLTLLGLLLRILSIVTHYAPNLMQFQDGEYHLYEIGAADFAVNHNFTNSLFLVRPPIFSLWIYLLGQNALIVLTANAIVGTLIVPASYWLACVLLKDANPSKLLPRLTALIVAIGPTSITYSSFLGPEPIANLTLVITICALITSYYAQRQQSAIWWSIAAGLLLAFSSLTRPAAYLLWIPLAAWLLLMRSKPWRRKLVTVVPFVALSVAGLLGWTVHNGIVFGYPTFSTIAPFTMAYYRAAAVEHQATGKDMNEVYTSINKRVEAALGHDTSNVDAEYRHRYLAATPEVAQALNDTSIQIFLKYPGTYLFTLLVGAFRLFTDIENSSGSISILRLFENIPLLTCAFIGTLAAFKSRQWLLAICVGLLFLYFVGGTLLVKSAGLGARERSMLDPFFAVACAYFIVELLKRRNQSQVPVARQAEPDLQSGLN